MIIIIAAQSQMRSFNTSLWKKETMLMVVEYTPFSEP